MSGPDEGMLTAQERAALASLEARAAADDPRLADHLRGLRASRQRLRSLPKPDLTWVSAGVARAWLALRPSIWGPLLTVAGLALVVLGLAMSLAVSALGVAMAAAGVGLLAQAAADRVERYREEQARLGAGSSAE